MTSVRVPAETDLPHVATYILEHGAEPAYAPLRKQLQGVGLGDVCPGEEHTLSLPDLVHGLGYLSPAQLVTLSSPISSGARTTTPEA